MALNCASLSAGDQGCRTAPRAARGDLGPSAVALAMVSGDSVFTARPGAIYAGPGPRQSVRPSVRTENRRLAAGGGGPTRLIKGGASEGRRRGRRARVSPYPAPGVKLDPLRSVLQRHLVALGGVAAAPVPA
ncbi:uncharacterized protein C11orf71 homolog [Loxodonta africana]|nr:uncharacterized protein C11orf71 homolog [Loxodonta africana]